MAGTTLADLKALSAVAVHQNFRAAAAELGISTSSLSHQVAAMERRLGIRLFNRTTRSVALSEAGLAFLDRVGPALREIDDAVATVGRLRDTPSGLLRLNSSEGGAQRILPFVLDFLATYPDMRVDLVSEGRLVDIVAGGFDAGVRTADTVPRDMISLSLGLDEAFVVVGSPDFFARHGRPEVPGDLLSFECLPARLPSGALYDWEFERAGEEIRIRPQGRLILGGTELTRAAAIAGAGLAYVTLREAEADLTAGRLEQVLAPWCPACPGICLYYPRQRLPSAGLKAFITHLRGAKRRIDAARREMSLETAG